MTDESTKASRQPPGYVQFLTEDDMQRTRRLIQIEPELSQLVRGKQAWQLVSETAKKVALWLSAMAGAFYVLKEIIRSMGA